jgi:hypothetical protein
MAYGNQGFGHVAFVLRSASLDFPSFSPDDGQSTQHGLQHAASSGSVTARHAGWKMADYRDRLSRHNSYERNGG